MSYIRHHSILVSSSSSTVIKEAHIVASKIFASQVSEVVETSHCFSFFVAPDGAKETCDESKTGDAARAQFIEWLGQKDCKNVLRWVELFFGEEYGMPFITNDSEKKKREKQSLKQGMIQNLDFN